MTIDLWKEICKLEGQTIKTLDQQRHFEVVRVEPKKVIVRVGSSGKEWPIRADIFEKAFQALVAEGHLSRCDMEVRFCKRGPAYPTAILSHLPEVTFTLRPITLWHRSARQPSLLAPDGNEDPS